jgi:hypothetical protein
MNFACMFELGTRVLRGIGTLGMSCTGIRTRVRKETSVIRAVFLIDVDWILVPV